MMVGPESGGKSLVVSQKDRREGLLSVYGIKNMFLIHVMGSESLPPRSFGSIHFGWPIPVIDIIYIYNIDRQDIGKDGITKSIEKRPRSFWVRSNTCDQIRS